jgi:hypothetical protein
LLKPGLAASQQILYPAFFQTFVALPGRAHQLSKPVLVRNLGWH